MPFPLLLFLFAIGSAVAGSATWQLDPTSGDWNTAANWTPNTVPNGPADTATFDISNTTGVFLSANTEANSIVFNPGASKLIITASPTFTLTISGVGITNNSGIIQNFGAAADERGNRGVIIFTDSARAGRGTVFTGSGAIHQGQIWGLRAIL